MDSSINKTKEDFINQAHEARQARELTRRRDKAATIVQAFFKAALVRQKLKKESFDSLEEYVKLSTFPDDSNPLTTFRRILFVCNPTRDRATLDALIKFILSSTLLRECPTTEPLKCNKSNPTDNRAPEQSIKEDIKDSDNKPHDDNNSKKDIDETKSDSTCCPLSKEETHHERSFIQILIEEASQSELYYNQWLDFLAKFLDLTLNYLEDSNSTLLDSQHIDTYLQIINLFTTDKLNQLMHDKTMPDSSNVNNRSDLINRITSELFDRTVSKKESFPKQITALICERFNRFRNDLKKSILSNYTCLMLHVLSFIGGISFENLDKQMIQKSKREKLVEIVASMLMIPGFIYNLEKHSPDSLKELNYKNFFGFAIRLLVLDQQDLQKFTSTSSLCLLSNLVHLASMNEDVLVQELLTFVVLTTRLLESCQKNMLAQTSNVTLGNTKPCDLRSCKKKNEDVSFNPILGWLSREQAISIDKDMLTSQLSHLWSMRFLKILLRDLINANEKNFSLITQAHGSSPTSPKHKSIVTKFNNQSNDFSFSSNQVGLLRRVVERAATTMTKTINSSYSKTTGGSNNLGNAKLMTPEANRISLVCLLLHTLLKTLVILKQDILTGLCLHDYILVNLWNFIKSLGPHNGLKAFLDHLTLYTKTSAPEFHILILFCECASHIISILDDTELYEKQRPFQLDDLVAISAFLNNFVFRLISNNLIPITGTQDLDPILQTTHKLLTDLYKRDCRRKFAPQDHWLIKDIKMSMFLKDLETGKPVAKTIMSMLPHIIPHKERVLIFRKLVARDKAQYSSGPSTLITIHRSRIVEDGYQQLVRLPSPALKGLIRVKFINDYGLDEAGIDQDGVFKEFLEDTIKRVFDPALNLFCSTSEQRLYPSPTSRLHEDYLSLFNFVGKMLGKAIYEGIVVDVPFASFFLSRVLGQPQSHLYSPIDELPSLDPELYKSLTYIKHYDGDVSELSLTFSIDQDFMGKIETHELEAGGRSIAVTRESRVRYIHSVANFRMKTQIEKQTEAFVAGFKSIINLEWLSMFSATELQRLISGEDTPIDLQDLRRNTKYFGGFHNNHRVVCWLWDILEKDFCAEERRLFLKFVTSCSKPPLLGFANLEPPFSIRCVEVSDDQDLGDTFGSVLRGFFAIRRSDPVDRLPTASTCFNLLKLPNYQRRSTLREKLRYAIRSNPGFELS